MRLGEWKAICRPFGGTLELYHLPTDPGEQRNVAAAHPEQVEAARRAMETAHVPSPLWRVRP